MAPHFDDPQNPVDRETFEPPRGGRMIDANKTACRSCGQVEVGLAGDSLQFAAQADEHA
jgi:hypothetical protein